MDARNFTYLCYGLITVWAVLMIYVITLIRRERNLEKELRAVRDLLEAEPGNRAGSSMRNLRHAGDD